MIDFFRLKPVASITDESRLYNSFDCTLISVFLESSSAEVTNGQVNVKPSRAYANTEDEAIILVSVGFMYLQLMQIDGLDILCSRVH